MIPRLYYYLDVDDMRSICSVCGSLSEGLTNDILFELATGTLLERYDSIRFKRAL